MLRNWKFWVVVLIVGLGIGIGAGWVTNRVRVNYHASRLLSDDWEIQSDEFSYWIDKNGLASITGEEAVCRAVLERLPRADAASIVEFYQSLDDYYRNDSLSAGIPFLIEAALECAQEPETKMFVLASVQAISRLHPDDIDDRALSAWRSASVYPEAQTRGGAIEYGIGLEPTQASEAIAWFLDDPDQVNARRAWMLMAFLIPISGHAGNWRDTPEGVGEAVLYAAVATSDRPELVLQEVEIDPELSKRYAPIRRFLSVVAEQDLDLAPHALTDDGHGRTQPRWSQISEHHTRLRSTMNLALSDHPEFYESARAMLPDCPLPPGPLTDAERAFAEQVFEAWWAVNARYYAFDEDAQVFRRIGQNE